MNFKCKFLAVFLVVLAAAFSNAQSVNFKITKSEIFKDKNTNSDLAFSASDENGGLVLLRHLYSRLGMSSRGYVLEYYDNNLKLVHQKEFEEKDVVFKEMFLKDNTINIIECIVNKKEKTIEYNALKVDLKSFSVAKENIFSLGKDKVKTPFAAAIGLFFISNYSKIDHDPTGEVQLSSNKEFIAFNFDLKDDKKETHKIYVYNNDLNLVYEKEFSQDIKDKYFVYNSFTVDDVNGSVFFLGKSYKNESLKEKKDGKINYFYKLYKVNSNDIKSETFDTENSFVGSLEVLANEKGVFCIGAYSDKDADDYRGIAYFKLNPETIKIEKSKLNPFTEQFMIDKYGEKKGKRKSDKNKELPYMTYKGFYITDKDEIFFCAEEQFITTHTNFNPNGGSTTYTVYHFNDIYACKMDFDGNLIWLRTINKAQATSGLIDYLSFSSTVNEGKMYMFLNGDDDIKKLRDNRISFKQAKIKKMNLYVIEVDNSGEFTYKILVSDKDSKVTFKPREAVFSSDTNSMLFEGNKGRDKQIAKIKF